MQMSRLSATEDKIKTLPLPEKVVLKENQKVTIARVSDISQLPALPGQRKRVIDYAEKNGWEKDKDYIHLEFDETAYTSEERKIFGQFVIEPLLKSKSTHILVFDKIDRFSRDSSSEQKSLLNRLRKEGKIEMHFPHDNLYVYKESPAADLFRLDVGVALGGYYSNTISDNVKRRFEKKIADGEWPGRAPIGYKNKRLSESRTTIEIDKDRAPLVKEAFELRARGLPYREIEKYMDQKGLTNLPMTNRRTGEKLPATKVRKSQWEEVLKNPFYYGIMRYKEELYPHKYEEIIDYELWQLVQDVNVQRSKKPTKYKSKQFIYRDVLSCQDCGYTISCDGPKKGGNIYLKCTEYGGKHGAVLVNEKIINEQTCEVLKSIYIDEKDIPKVIKELEKSFNTENRSYKQLTEQLRTERDALDSDLKIMYKDRLRGRLGEEEYDKMVKDVKQQQRVIDKRLSKRSDNNEEFLLTSNKLLEIANMAETLFNAKSSKVELKQQLLKIVLSNPTLQGKKLYAPLKKPFDSIQTASKDNSWLRGEDSNLRPKR